MCEHNNLSDITHIDQILAFAYLFTHILKHRFDPCLNFVKIREIFITKMQISAIFITKV